MMTNKQKATALYVAVYNRAPDQEGLDYWTSQLDNGVAYSIMAKGFIGHPIFKRDYADLDNKKFVEAIYHNMLGSAGDYQGINYWTDRLDKGLSTEDFITSFIEAVFSYNGNDYSANNRKDTLVNRVKVAQDYTEKMGAQSNFPEDADLNSLNILAHPMAAMAADVISGVGYSNESVLKALKTNSMKAGIISWEKPNQDVKFGERDLTHDTDDLWGTAYNDTFNGNYSFRMDDSVQLLNTGDHIDGGKGTDTLRATLTGRQWKSNEERVEYTNDTIPFLTSVENVHVTSKALGQVLDLTQSTGIESIQINSTSYAMSVLGVQNANVSINRFYDADINPVYLEGIQGKAFNLRLDTGEQYTNTIINLDTTADIKTETVTFNNVGYGENNNNIYGDLSTVKEVNVYNGTYLNLIETNIANLETLNVNNTGLVTIQNTKADHLQTVNLQNGTKLSLVGVDASNLDTINVEDSRYRSYDYEVDFTQSTVADALTINMGVSHNFAYSSQAQQSAETFKFNNKSFNAVRIENFDVKGAVKDKLDLSAFAIVSTNELDIYQGIAESANSDIIIKAKNGQFDGRIHLIGVLEDGMDATQAVADSFVFA